MTNPASPSGAGAAAPPAVARREPRGAPSRDALESRHARAPDRRRRARRRSRHAHEVGHAQGAPPDLRAPDARLRARRRRDGDRLAPARRLLAGDRGRPRRRRGARRRRRSRTRPAARATRCARRSTCSADDGRRRSSSSRATCRSSRADLLAGAARGPRHGPRGDLARVRGRDRPRPASAGSSATTGGTVERIVEDKDATDDERQISEINAGLYAFDAAWLRAPDRATCDPRRPPASCTSRSSSGSRARTAAWWPRSTWTTTDARPGSTTGPSSRAPSGTCGSRSTTAGCGPASR